MNAEKQQWAANGSFELRHESGLLVIHDCGGWRIADTRRSLIWPTPHATAGEAMRAALTILRAENSHDGHL
jgi:hypothetical protein